MMRTAKSGLTGCGGRSRPTEGGVNPKDAYQAQWIGSRGRNTQLGGDGSPIVGIIGHHDGRRIMSIGVVLVEKP